MNREECAARLNAIRALSAQTQWTTAAAIQSSRNVGQRDIEEWKCRGHIFAVSGPDGGEMLFPAYQFDAEMKPLPVIQAILHELGPLDPWTIVGWFHFPNGWLVRTVDGSSQPLAPKDCLQDFEGVVAAARKHGRTYVA